MTTIPSAIADQFHAKKPWEDPDCGNAYLKINRVGFRLDLVREQVPNEELPAPSRGKSL